MSKLTFRSKHFKIVADSVEKNISEDAMHARRVDGVSMIGSEREFDNVLCSVRAMLKLIELIDSGEAVSAVQNAVSTPPGRKNGIMASTKEMLQDVLHVFVHSKDCAGYNNQPTHIRGAVFYTYDNLANIFELPVQAMLAIHGDEFDDEITSPVGESRLDVRDGDEPEIDFNEVYNLHRSQLN